MLSTAPAMHSFCLSVAFFVISQGQALDSNQDKQHLSLADQTRIIQFAHEHGLAIASIPDTWRAVAERNGVEALLQRLKGEFNKQSPNQQEEYLEVKAGSFMEMY